MEGALILAVILSWTEDALTLALIARWTEDARWMEDALMTI